MLDENEKGLSDYLDVVWRRKYYFFLTFPLLALIAISVALTLPPVYESKGVILIESQEIPDDLVKSTVTSFAQEQIEIIKQRVLTTTLIQEAIKKHGLYPQQRGKASTTELAQEFRNNVSVKMVNARIFDSQRGRTTTATIAFNVSFMDSNPSKAHAVANDLVTTFLSENVKVRTDRATETTQFLKEEADRMRSRVQVLEDRIAQFKTEYSGSLPEILPFNLSMIENGEQRLQGIQTQEAQIKDQIHLLNIELASTSKYIEPIVNGTMQLTSDQRLIALEDELSQLRNRYSDAHPDIVRLKRELELLKQSTVDSVTTKSDRRELNPKYQQLRLQIVSLEKDLQRISAQTVEVEKSLEEYKARVAQTPQVQRGFEDLSRDYENELRKYKELRAKELEAEISQNMESESKAESFSLLEPPLVPSVPVKPDRRKLGMLGIIASAAISIGLIFLVELIDGGVRGVNGISSIVGQDPLVSIPILATKSDLKIKKIKRNLTIAVGGVLFICLVLAVHYFYMPLDILWFKVTNRLNLL